MSTNQLMLYGQISTVYYKHHNVQKYIFGQNADISMLNNLATAVVNQ
jgi:hypothetical protein